jgi:hypothetical protein
MSKIKMTEDELRGLVRESLKKRFLKESATLSAKRKLTLLAKEHSMDFEEKIVNTLNLVDPDTLDEELQKQYVSVVEKMQSSVVAAVQEAVSKLATFPREDDGSRGVAKVVKATPTTSTIPRADNSIPKV